MPDDHLEGAGLVFGQGLWPIGWSVGFVERDLEVMTDVLAQSGDAPDGVAFHPDESLDQLLARLLPLENPYRRRLLARTQSGWTAYFDNSDSGGDTWAWTAYHSRDLGCRGVIATHKPPEQHRYPVTSLEIFSPEGEPPYGELRTISTFDRDDGQWRFEAAGEIQPFERPEMYDAAFIPGRLTREALLEYLSAMGIRADDADWYRGGVVYEKRWWPQLGEPRRFTLQEARDAALADRRAQLRGSWDRSYYAAADPQDELARLRLIEQEADPTTFRHLDRLGIGSGWRVLEVGAGGASIVRWLANQVGPAGSVVAADIDPRFVDEIDLPNVEVRGLHELEHITGGTYYVVHARRVLMHSDDPYVLSRMYSQVRDDGGWLVVEEPDYGTIEAIDDSHELSAAFNDAIRKWVRAVTGSGVANLRSGRNLLATVARESTLDLGNEGTMRVAQGGQPLSLTWSMTWEGVNDQLLAGGAMTEAEMAVLRQAFEDPTFHYREPLMQAVWVRRPERG